MGSLRKKSKNHRKKEEEEKKQTLRIQNSPNSLPQNQVPLTHYPSLKSLHYQIQQRNHKQFKSYPGNKHASTITTIIIEEETELGQQTNMPLNPANKSRKKFTILEIQLLGEFIEF